MENDLEIIRNDLNELRDQVDNLEQEVFINLSTKKENYASPQEARSYVPENARVNGLLIAYFCNNRLLVDKFTGHTEVQYLNPFYWEAQFGTQDNGKITDLNYIPQSWELRKGSYFTSELKGEFTNFSIQINSFYLYQDGVKKIFPHIDIDGNLEFVCDMQEKYTGNEFQWGAITKGAIEHLETFVEDGKCYANVKVYPNTLCAGMGNNFTVNGHGTNSFTHDKKVLEGTFKLEINFSNWFTLAVDKNGYLAAFSPAGQGDPALLPYLSDRNDYLLIGFFGFPDPNVTFFTFAPYSGEHVIKNIALKEKYSINASQRTFVDISAYVENLTFKGEALLNENISPEEDTYYMTCFDNPGTYTYDNIPLTVTTTKPKTPVAIRYKKDPVDGIYKWDYVEVPSSTMVWELYMKVGQYTLDEGIYVITDGSIYTDADIIGTSKKVKIIGLGKLFDLSTVNVKNIDAYNVYFHDYSGKLSYSIEDCIFSGHPSRYHGALYFLLTSFYQQGYQTVAIRNCIFNLPQLFIAIAGIGLDYIEITGCTFNTPSISYPIRIYDTRKGALIRNNTVLYGAAGIFFGSNREMPISNCTVENNIVMYQGEEAISFDGFGNNFNLVPVIGNGRILDAYNDANGRLVVKPKLIYHYDVSQEPPYPELPISQLNNWTDYYATFNRGTGIDGTLCRIYSYDPTANTLTLDIFMDASKVNTSEDSFFGVQSGFFDCVIRDNVIKSDRQDYCTGISLFLNVFNMIVENNKVYMMNSFMNVAGGLSLSAYETLAWGNKIINNTFMNCNTGTFYSYYPEFIPQYNNVFRGNILKNVKNIRIEEQRNFDYKDNIFDNVDTSDIIDCEGYVPDESDLKVHELGQIYNKFINDSDKRLIDIEQKIVRRDTTTGLLTLKNLA